MRSRDTTVPLTLAACVLLLAPAAPAPATPQDPGRTQDPQDPVDPAVREALRTLLADRADDLLGDAAAAALDDGRRAALERLRRRTLRAMGDLRTELADVDAGEREVRLRAFRDATVTQLDRILAPAAPEGVVGAGGARVPAATEARLRQLEAELGRTRQDLRRLQATVRQLESRLRIVERRR